MERSRHIEILRCWVVSLGLLMACAADATGYPDKPITLLVPQAPGGANDVVARLVAKEMGTRLGQAIAVDNRPGAGGNIGTVMAARAAPNGYTLLMTVNSTQAINPLLYKNAGFDPVKDFVAIGAVGSVPYVLLVNSSSKLESLDGFLQHARSRPGQVRYGSAGNGTLPHLMAASLADRGAVELTHVPYKGIGQAVNDLLAGQIDLAFVTVSAALPHVRAGTLRALCVTSTQRVPTLSGVPTVAETFPGYQGILWIALYAPNGTPANVLETLSEALVATRQSATFQNLLASMGVDPLNEAREELDQRLAAETRRWGDLIQKIRLSVD